MRLMLVVLAACSSDGGSPGPDAGGAPLDGGGAPLDGGGGPNDGGGNRIASTLTSSCATLQGRAIVNENGNLGIAFTEDDTPFTFLGSIQFELPSGFTGTIPNPEAWDGSSPRRIVAMTTPAYELHGNHCWNGGTPAGGSVTITEYRPLDGVVKAAFTNLPLRSCTGTSICTVSGSIETTDEGVFD